jgi:signal transduction histidine kinase
MDYFADRNDKLLIKKAKEVRILRSAFVLLHCWLLYRHYAFEGGVSFVVLGIATVLVSVIFFSSNQIIVSHQSLDSENLLMSQHNLQLVQQIGDLDMETRRELGAWLHSTVQPKLLASARKAWSMHREETDELARNIDALNEDIVRRYSHHLFPVQLEIALSLALADLLHGRTTISFDQRMLPATDISVEQKPIPNISTASAEELLPKNQVYFPIAQRYAIYRIVEEAVANAEKKMKATEISVDISIPDKQIVITVTDNGEPIDKSMSPGLGTRLIDVFTLRHGGSWQLSNIPDGVKFTCVLPVSSEFRE